MAIINSFGINYDDVYMDTDRLYVRLLRASDCSEWIRSRQINFDHLQKWEPIWDMDHLTYVGFNRFLKNVQNGFRSGGYYALVVFEKDTASLVGHIELGNVLSWPKNSASLGYWLCHTHQGKGYMTEATKAACDWAMAHLNLVKIEAGTMSDNEKSQAVLKRLGFAKEGYSKSYGEIDGTFKDHLLWGLTAQNHYALKSASDHAERALQ